MSVRTNKGALREALERAVRIADRGQDIPNRWLQRTEHMGDSPSKTFVAFLGNALLARATYGEAIDPRAIKLRAGERGYSVRGTVSVLVDGKRDFGYGLGAEKAEPLNNQPFLRPARVEEIGLETVKAGAREYLRSLKGYLRDIDSIDAREAERALAAFIVVRRRVAEAARKKAAAELKSEPVSLPRLARVVAAFVADQTESGRRGQALAAAALDCALPRVELGAIHDPDAFDVIAFRDEEQVVPSFAVQVKQKVVDEEAAMELAEAAADEGVPTALLIAIGAGQPPIDEESVAGRTESLGVSVLVITSVAQLLRGLAAYSAVTPREIATQLPRAFDLRMREIECEPSALQQWEELVAELV
jgi:hypothetical protein